MKDIWAFFSSAFFSVVGFVPAMEGIAPHPKYQRTQVCPPLPWWVRIRRMGRGRLALIAALVVGGAGFGFWFIAAKQAPADSEVIDLTGGGRLHEAVDGHRHKSP